MVFQKLSDKTIERKGKYIARKIHRGDYGEVSKITLENTCAEHCKLVVHVRPLRLILIEGKDSSDIHKLHHKIFEELERLKTE